MENPENLNGTEHPVEDDAAPQVIPLTEIGQLVNLLGHWHHNRLAQLDAAMNVPDDIEVTVTDNATGEESVLTKEQLIGFRAGISVVRSLFEKLPIVVEFQDEDNDK